MTDRSPGLGNGDHPPRRPDPAARRAQLDALRASSSTSGKGFAASPRRRHHAALASRVLATGLAAGSSVGLIGLLARADQVGAQDRPATTVPAALPAVPVERRPVLLPNETSTTAPATTAPTTVTTLPPQRTAAPGAAAPGANVTAPPQTAPPQTAPPQTAPPQTAPPTTRPAPPVTAPPATVPPTTGTGAS